LILNPIDAVVALILLVGLLVNTQPVIPIAAIGVVALRGMSTRLTKGIGFKKVEWAVVFCLAYWLASYIWSTGDLGNLVSFGFLRNDGAMLFSYSALIFFLGWPLKPRQCRVFWMAFLAVLSLVAVAGTAVSLNLPYSYLLEPLGLVDESQVGAIFFGWYHAHNTAGGVYAVAVVLALALLQEPKVSPNQKIFRWVLLACCLSGLLVTYSRGAYIAFVAGAAIILPLRKLSTVFKAALLVVVPAGLILAMSSSLVRRLDSTLDTTDPHATDRFAIWSRAWGDFADSPFIGMGYGRFNDLIAQYWGIKGIVWVATKAEIINDDTHAHNSYLHFLAEGGLVGLFVTMLVWWYAWKKLSFFESYFPRSKLYWLERGAQACLAVVMVQALTEHVLGRGSVVLTLDALIGITLASAGMEANAAKAAISSRPDATAKTARPLLRQEQLVLK
jgi:O-antigen ligase